MCYDTLNNIDKTPNIKDFMLQNIELTTTIDELYLGYRLDQALADIFPDYSRSRIKTWVEDGCVSVNGQTVTKPREKLLGGEKIEINATLEEHSRFKAQDLPLNIVYEDEHILVINKPRDYVVHPGAGNPDGTLLNALLYAYPSISEVPRAGIVHRLDKDTTGLMVVAKTIPAQTHLVDALQKREIVREYEAVVMGIITAGGEVDQPIARHPTKRTHMSVYPMGKPALTYYRVMEKYREHTRLRLRLATGRTHQIRVHMAYINHALIGDPLYGARARLPKNASEELIATLRAFDRQALHATLLRLHHPITGELMEWQAPLPDDMVQLIDVLKRDKEHFQSELDW